MKHLYFFILATFTAFSPCTQADWTGEHHGDGIIGAIAADSSGNRILLSLAFGGYWLTNDGGQHWQQTNDRLTEASIINAVTGYGMATASFGANADTIVTNFVTQNPYSSDYAHYTINGGVDWHVYDVYSSWPDTLSSLIIRASPMAIFPDRIYQSRQAGFATSHDHGSSWQVTPITEISKGIQGMYLRYEQADTVYLFGAWGYSVPDNQPVGGILASHDGGVCWDRLTIMEELTDEAEGSIYSMTQGSDGNLYATTFWHHTYAHTPLLHSWNYGETWEWAACTGLPQELRPQEVMAVPEVQGRLYTGGTDFGLWQSDDHGESWTQAYAGLPNAPKTPGALYRNEYSGHLYVSFYDQGLYQSTDYGESWHKIPSPPVGAATFQHGQGLIIMEGGILQATTDYDVYYALNGNIDYHKVPHAGLEPGSQYRLFPITYTDSILAVSKMTTSYEPLIEPETYSILFSTDDGYSWSESGSNDFELYDSPLKTVAVQSDTGTVYVGSGATSHHLYRTFDSGNTWEFLEMPYYYSLLQVIDNVLYAKSVDSYETSDIIKSDDYGMSWVEMNFPDPINLCKVQTESLILDDTLFVLTSRDMWVYSPDQQWQRRGSQYSDDMDVQYLNWDCVYTPADTFFVVGAVRRDEIAISHDFGWSWSEQDIEMPGEYSKEVCLALAYDPWRDRLWLDTGVGLAYLDDPTSAVGEDVWVFQPANYVTLDAYPNPFNASTTIRYTLTRPGAVKLTVFDLLGRQVAELYDGVARPGEHTVSFDGSGLSSGTYFLHLTTDDQAIDRKLTLVK